MFASRRLARNRLIAIKFLLLISAFPISAHGKDGNTNPSYFGEARKFLGALYPELQQSGLTVSYSISSPFDSDPMPELRTFSVLITRTQSVSVLQSSVRTENVPAQSATLPNVNLSAGFSYNLRGGIVRFSANAPWPLSSDKNEAMRKLVDAHPKWSDQKILEQLSAKGAKFGPNDKTALLSVLPLERLEPFLGKLTVRSAEFQIRHKQPDGTLALLSWNLEIEASSASGERSSYFVSVEPFGGKINLLTRRPNR